MFTGIIEEIGAVVEIDRARLTDGLKIRANVVLESSREGDSMAVNGACLTITSVAGQEFTVGVVSETLRRTNLGTLRVGDQLNLERALRADSRMGGHYVQGHIDGTGRIISVEPDGNALAIRLEPPATLLRYIVEKGFVAIDGASLTVTSVDESGFGVALIPYTQIHVARGLRTIGYTANIEVDILAKYVEKLVLH